MKSNILGISAYYHDSAAAIIVNGEIIAAAQEERFTRKKHDSNFPVNAIKYVLYESGLTLADIEVISFYDKPYIKFERLLETYHAFTPRGLISFLSAIPLWIKEKLFMKKIIRDELSILDKLIPPIIFPEHHLSHAASAFYPSPFDEAAILTIDGVGEWATSTIGLGESNSITVLREQHFPHSLGLLYSAFTYYCGFKVNSGEYKLMGLAPYGVLNNKETKHYKNMILTELVDIKNDGSILLNMKYFSFATGLRMCNDKRWERLFGFPPRKPESDITENYVNLALAAQMVTEEIVIKLAKTAKQLTGKNSLVMAGGVALNCVANGKLLRENIFENLWIQPAAGDAGGALGAALAGFHIWKGGSRIKTEKHDLMKGAYLGPEYSNDDIYRSIQKYDTKYEKFKRISSLTKKTANLIADGNIVGWFQGRMEYGPRALGNRSILGDARNPEMQKKLNLKIKYRESFRPFAPSVLEEDTNKYFDLYIPSPYMLLVSTVKKNRQKSISKNSNKMNIMDRLYKLRSDIPAITHVDNSARIQTIDKERNNLFYQLISEFKKLTGYSLIVNTSFNVRGEPIVCTPEDAYLCFMRTEMDYLVMGNFLFNKKDQKKLEENIDWKQLYTLD